jgi:arylsulfatase A-like enzyme
MAAFAACAAIACSKAPATAPEGDAHGALPAHSASASAQAAPPEPSAPKGPFNVILITIDSLRADMPWNGYPRDIAPRLTELEKRSVSFSHAYAISSFTSKSVGGLLGGNYPSAMTRDGVFFTRYFPNNVMFPELLHDAGVRTIAGHAHMYLDKGRGFDQGFDDYRLVDGITFDYNKDPYVTSQKLTPLAIRMLGDAGSGTFFAWFHFMDPHDTYQPHPEGPDFGRRARDLYDGEVLYTDQWVGKLLDFVEAAPWGKRTALIVTADHGEAFGEHGLYRHAHELWEELVHVPLLVVVPGTKPRRVLAARSQIDLGPTILDLTGVGKRTELRGESLVPEIMSGSDAPARPVICDLPEDTYNDRRRALIEDGYKLIAFGNDARYELYDLGADPAEKNNLFRKERDRAKAMVARYKEISATIPEGNVRGGVIRKE